MSNRQTSPENGANMPRSAFAMIATGEGEDRRYLLQWNPKWEMFNLVGGKLDNSKGDNDSLKRTIQRELNEELGLKPEEEYLIVRELQQIELQQFSYRDQVTKNYLFSIFEVELFPRLPIDPRMRINAARWLSTGRENIFVSQSELNNLVTHSGWPISITARRILQEIGEIPKFPSAKTKPQTDLLPPEERAALNDAQKAAQETVQVQELIQRLAEMESTLQVKKKLKKGPGGETAALIDVNLLKQTRRALQESEARYRRLVTRMPIVVCELTAGGTTLFVNNAITKATGYLPEELQGQNWWQILSPHDRAQVKELRRHCQRGDVSDFELRLQSKDKSELSLIWYSTSTFDANGRLEKITGYGTNITRRKQVETELRKKETLFRLALDNIPDIVLILDANRRVQFINAQGNYFGRLTEEIYLGETLANIFPSYLVEKYAPLLAEAYRTGETQTGEFEVALSKRTISLEVSVIPTLNEAGTVQQVLVLTEDVTRRRRMEEQLRRSEKAQR